MGDEDTADARRAALAPYRIDDALLDRAAPGAIALHCLPAHPGEEITAEVLYGPRQRIWDQAENRRHAQKALLELLVLGRGRRRRATEREKPPPKPPATGAEHLRGRRWRAELRRDADPRGRAHARAHQRDARRRRPARPHDPRRRRGADRQPRRRRPPPGAGPARRRRALLGAAARAPRRAPTLAARSTRRAAPPASARVPDPGYDDLTAAQVAERLGDLAPPELRKVRDHERRNANRKSVLAAIERAAGARPARRIRRPQTTTRPSRRELELASTRSPTAAPASRACDGLRRLRRAAPSPATACARSSPSASARYGEARALEVLEPSPSASRRAPTTRARRGRCCPTSASSRSRPSRSTTRCARIGKLDGFELEPIVPADEQWRYRNKLEYSFGTGDDGELVCGFHAPGSWERIVDDRATACSPPSASTRRATRSLAWCRAQGLPAYDRRTQQRLPAQPRHPRGPPHRASSRSASSPRPGDARRRRVRRARVDCRRRSAGRRPTASARRPPAA